MSYTCSFATPLRHLASPARHLFISGIARRALMGLAIGATVMALIMSPWGKRPGGHINPAMTFAIYRLGKLRPWDASLYGSMSLGHAIPAPLRPPPESSAHHQIPPGFRVRSSGILGGLHHEYWLEKEVA